MDRQNIPPIEKLGVLVPIPKNNYGWPSFIVRARSEDDFNE